MNCPRRGIASGLAVLLLALLLPAAAGAAETIRVGVLKFGTVNWQLDVIKSHGLDRAAGLDLDLVELAGKDATTVALLAGRVDVIVTDWLWVARQRAAGDHFAFIPYSTAVGALMVPPGSPLRTLADLRGRRLGIAGGPLDKSWLLIRAMALEREHLDLDAAADKVFGAPPLMNQEALSGRLDAVISFWNFLAALQAKGFRPLVTVADAARAVGISGELPLLGYVFDDRWAEAHRAALLGLAEASRQAGALLARSDAEWDRLRPLMQAPDEATFAALRSGYRQGIPTRWGPAERDAAARAYAVLARIGGPALVGSAPSLPPGVFWPDVAY
jgi:NitT/TauT family transport system substrate-binding protein